MTAAMSPGAGAMLARLIGLGSLCGLSAEAVLLHVLDGAPLPDPKAAAPATQLAPGETNNFESPCDLQVGPASEEALDTIRFAQFGKKVSSPYPAGRVEAPAALPEVENDGLVFAIPECDPGLDPGEQERLDGLDELQATALFQTVAEASAMPQVQAETSKMERTLDLWATTDLDYRGIAHEISSTAGSVYERLRQAKKRNDARWMQGFTRRDLMMPSLSGAEGRKEAAAQQEQAPADGPEEPSEVVEPACHENSAETANEAPMVVDGAGDDCSTELRSKSSDIPPAGEHGEARRGLVAPDVSPAGATEVVGEACAHTPVPDLAVSPALPPFDPVPEGPVRRESGSAVRPARPGAASEAVRDEPELADDQAVAIRSGWIVGPAGTRKGFPLVNAVLSVLAGGDLIGTTQVAERAGARSAAAVRAVLDQWREDLEAIGVEVIHFGDSVRLRRAGAQ